MKKGTTTPQKFLKSEYGFTHAEKFDGKKYGDNDVFLVRKNGSRGAVSIVDSTITNIFDCMISSKEKIKSLTSISCRILNKTLGISHQETIETPVFNYNEDLSDRTNNRNMPNTYRIEEGSGIIPNPRY